MSKKKTKTDAGEDVTVNHLSSIATGDGLPAEAAPPPSDPPLAPPSADALASEFDLPSAAPVEAPPAKAGDSLSPFDMQLPRAAPVAPVAAVATDPALEARIRHLEALLSQVQNLQNLEQRVAERVTTQIQRQQPAPATSSSGPSVFGQARTLLDVGRNLLPSLPPGQAPPRPRGWLVWEMIAEARAIFCMYLDPRYRMPWYAYVLPPALLLAFIFSKYWVPFALVLGEARLSWVLTIPVDLILLYAMFKVLGHEARRYRETAPDLPPSLRL